MTKRALRHLERLITGHGKDGRLLPWSDLRTELQDIGIQMSIRSAEKEHNSTLPQGGKNLPPRFGTSELSPRRTNAQPPLSVRRIA